MYCLLQLCSGFCEPDGTRAFIATSNVSFVAGDLGNDSAACRAPKPAMHRCLPAVAAAASANPGLDLCTAACPIHTHNQLNPNLLLLLLLLPHTQSTDFLVAAEAANLRIDMFAAAY
jgi:hypothetical protein